MRHTGNQNVVVEPECLTQLMPKTATGQDPDPVPLSQTT